MPLLNPDENIKIENINFQGLGTFSEHHHCIAISNSKNVSVKHCKFTKIQGDGIYIGPPTGAFQNKNTLVEDCYFDGNFACRNGVSVTSCNNAVINHNYFTRFSHYAMPGPIDIEPDNVSYDNVEDEYYQSYDPELAAESEVDRLRKKAQK